MPKSKDSFAMENANQSIKNTWQEIIPSNNHYGVLKTLLDLLMFLTLPKEKSLLDVRMLITIKKVLMIV